MIIIMGGMDLEELTRNWTDVSLRRSPSTAMLIRVNLTLMRRVLRGAILLIEINNEV